MNTEFNRRIALKMLASLMASAALSGCTSSQRESDCKNYQFAHFNAPNSDALKLTPVWDMHAHFFNATDLLTVQYIMGPVLNDYLGNSFPFTRVLLTRVASGILGVLLNKKEQIQASEELKWLNSSVACSPGAEYGKVSKEFFDVVSEEDHQKSLTTNREAPGMSFNALLNASARELQGGFEKSNKLRFQQNPEIEFTEDTILNAIVGNSIYEQQKGLKSRFRSYSRCPDDPGFFSRIFAFAGRALVRRSTNIQDYYDRYSREPLYNGAGVRHVMNIGCDFDFFLSDIGKLSFPHNQAISPIKDQIAVNEKLWEHTNGFAIPVLGVNPYKAFYDDDYCAQVDGALARGVYKGVKLYPSIGYSVTGKLRSKLHDFKFQGKGITELQLQKGINKLLDIVQNRKGYVTSHTTYSKGAESGAEALADSKYWGEVLKERPDLRVNFGHMGDTADRISDSWRTGFLDLMLKYDNVYADFGYHEYANYTKLKSDLQFLKNYQGMDSNKLFQRITYGSDWFMISKDKGANAYLCSTITNFRKAITENLLDEKDYQGVFYGNASQFLTGRGAIDV
ncbi:hypothetical protein [Planctobacterium marinum]|uniref:Amidohydrolase-related domain-containing protein n=1 Tax=Planctobacterium marinum TaxID=1631968 RepID=A0AA48HN15_9ALTE|nr:hypothetical protein MACH26_03800 [Planctobacterium marinum]